MLREVQIKAMVAYLHHHVAVQHAGLMSGERERIGTANYFPHVILTRVYSLEPLRSPVLEFLVKNLGLAP
jgi:hypothetical protein